MTITHGPGNGSGHAASPPASCAIRADRRRWRRPPRRRVDRSALRSRSAWRRCTRGGRRRHQDDERAVEPGQLRPVVVRGRHGCPDTTVTCALTCRSVTAMPPSAGAARADDTPGTTSTTMPASSAARTSSMPRPKRNGSPPLRRTTRRPAGVVGDHQLLDAPLVGAAALALADVDRAVRRAGQCQHGRARPASRGGPRRRRRGAWRRDGSSRSGSPGPDRRARATAPRPDRHGRAAPGRTVRAWRRRYGAAGRRWVRAT